MDIRVLFCMPYSRPYPVSNLKSDFLILRISSNQIWVVENLFKDKFNVKIIQSVYIHTNSTTKENHACNGIQPSPLHLA
jgi:hypothetical protein